MSSLRDNLEPIFISHLDRRFQNIRRLDTDGKLRAKPFVVPADSEFMPKRFWQLHSRTAILTLFVFVPMMYYVSGFLFRKWEQLARLVAASGAYGATFFRGMAIFFSLFPFLITVVFVVLALQEFSAMWFWNRRARRLQRNPPPPPPPSQTVWPPPPRME